MGFGKENMPAHSNMLHLIGTGLLWVGWFGFNAGSAVAAGGLASSAFAATHFAAAAGGIGWTLMEWLRVGKPSVLGTASGMVAGLATITPASGFVSVPAAIMIGLVAGGACYLAVTKVKKKFGYDDSLDAFGVHGVGSTIGMTLTGLFASITVNPAIATTFKPAGVTLSLAGGGSQVLNQLQGVAFTWVLAGVATFAILKLVDKIVGLRVSEDEELRGLDIAQHGEEGYNVL